MTALLVVEHLHVRYPLLGAIRAQMLGIANRFLDAVLDVSFKIEAGTTFALVGESGSGKSTLGRAIVGLIPVTSGKVYFGDIEPLAVSGTALADYRRNVAMMFQDPVASLSPRLTVRSLITEPFAIHGLKERDFNAEAKRLLGLVGLPMDFASRYPHQLSGGQARRVGIARALALSPQLVIADEPIAGLDVSVQGEILNLLARLQGDLGLTYLIITHNLAVVRHVSDVMAIMYMGRFVEYGPTQAIFAAPAHPYTHGLLAAQPQPDPTKRRDNVELHGEVPSLAKRPVGCEFHTRCPKVRDYCLLVRPEQQLIGPEHGHRCHFPRVEAAV
jgi:oligopeptide/dipeptide ABC transporter ATP-binding protein